MLLDAQNRGCQLIVGSPIEMPGPASEPSLENQADTESDLTNALVSVLAFGRET
jgi:hypothetical protein